jgi:predicted phosphodiesterase
MSYNTIRPGLHGNKRVAFEHLTSVEKRILVVGDLHEPFTHPDYLDFCKEVYAKYLLNKVVFIGDIIDSHGWSYHESDPDGLSPGDELSLAVKKVSKWYKAFPKADVCIGNHDRLASRKIFSAGVPRKWLRSYNEILHTPKWKWVENVTYDDVLYEHGEGGQAQAKAKNNMMSSVCGHTHTEAYVKWFVGKRFRCFAMQTGCGIDIKSYAAAYAKNFKRQALGCGVVLGGHTAFNCMMDL